MISYFSVSFKLRLIEKKLGSSQTWEEKAFSREILFSNRYEQFKTEDFDNLRISASNVSSKSLGILCEETNHLTDHQILWIYMPSQWKTCISWCLSYGCGLYPRVCYICIGILALKSCNAAASNGANISLSFLFYPPSNKILSGSIREAERKSVRGKLWLLTGEERIRRVYGVFVEMVLKHGERQDH